MKNGVHLKSAHLPGRRSLFLTKKTPVMGRRRCRDERPTSAFRVISRRTFFFFLTNAIRPISPSSTAFNQCIKIVWLGHIWPDEKACLKESTVFVHHYRYWRDFFFFFSRNIKAPPPSSVAAQTESDSPSASKHTAFSHSVKMTSCARPPAAAEMSRLNQWLYVRKLWFPSALVRLKGFL